MPMMRSGVAVLAIEQVADQGFGGAEMPRDLAAGHMMKLTETREISPYVWVHPPKRLAGKVCRRTIFFGTVLSAFKTGETALRGIFSSA